ncbi:hypothetical protein EC988_001430, partial [Linderina pennispora]
VQEEADISTAGTLMTTDTADREQRDRLAGLYETDHHQKSIARQDIDRPLLIVAGAGSGKTNTLCTRAIEMIKQGVAAETIMVITFTNKAAGELSERIGKLMEANGMKDASPPHSSTFHSWCYKLIREYYVKLGLSEAPDIVTEDGDLKLALHLGFVLLDDCHMLVQCETMLAIPHPDSGDGPGGQGTILKKDRLRRWDAVKAQATERLDWQEPPADPAPDGGMEQNVRAKLNSTMLKSDFAAHSVLYHFLRGHFHRIRELRDITATPLARPLHPPGHSGFAESDAYYAYNLGFVQSSKTRGYLATSYNIQKRSMIEAYNAVLRMANVVDYDDMLAMANDVLKSPTILQITREKYRYLLIDEFQDLNTVQMDLVMLLQKDAGRITAVGDERQSIYGFRGATCKSNFSRFLENFVDANMANTNNVPRSLVGSMESLVINYRSHRSIVDLGNIVATAVNTNSEDLLTRLRVPLQAQPSVPMMPVVVSSSETADSEARSMARKIRSLVYSRACQPKDIAVLFRALKLKRHRPSSCLEIELLDLGIPYVIRGGASFIGDASVQNLLAPLRLMVDRTDDAAMRTCLSEFVPNIGPRFIERICAMEPDTSDDTSVYGKAERILDTKVLPKHARASLKQFMDTIGQWDQGMGEMTLQELVSTVCCEYAADGLAMAMAKLSITSARRSRSDGSGREQDFGKKSITTVLRNTVAIFFSGHVQGAAVAKLRFKDSDMCSHAMLRSFLAYVSLMAGISKDTIWAGVDAVVISTVHQAKGLEWEHVFISNFNEGTFPMKYRGDPEAVAARLDRPAEELDSAEKNYYNEESNIAYVAITRAKRGLYISVIETNPFYGIARSSGVRAVPSRYLPVAMWPLK